MGSTVTLHYPRAGEEQTWPSCVLHWSVLNITQVGTR